MEWITPVFDRTLEDVEAALAQIAIWKQSESFLMNELKGCRNISDINRIENNIQFLENELSSYYYFPGTFSKIWSIEGLPNLADINRVLNNVQNIIDAFYQFADASLVPGAMIRYNEINAVEENLYLIKILLDVMISLFRKSGTFQCNKIRLLPMSRG